MASIQIYFEGAKFFPLQGGGRSFGPKVFFIGGRGVSPQDRRYLWRGSGPDPCDVDAYVSECDGARDAEETEECMQAS